jgi:predicted GNAT family acetyltransferase
MFDFELNSYEKLKGQQDKTISACIMRPMDEAAAQICDVNVDWGTTANFMEKSFGFYISHDNDIVSEAHVGYIGSGMAEIGVYTDEKFRGKGYAALTVSAVIEKCLSMGLRPSWSCWDLNEASSSLARKAGFIEKTDIRKEDINA